MDAIRYQIDTIFESIQMSRLGVMSKPLLYLTEEIEISTYDQTYEYLEPSAFHNGSSVILMVKIPKFKIGDYQLLRIETIPFDQKVIQINATYALISETASFLTNEKCTQVEKNLLCSNENLILVTRNQCYHQILRGNPNRCPFINSNLKSPKIILLGNGPKTLTGSFFITFSNCSVIIGEKQNDSKTFKFEAKCHMTKHPRL